MDRQRARIRRSWAAFFEHHDVLVCPVIASPPFAHLQTGSMADRMLDIDGTPRRYTDLLWWTILIGMAYLPSTVVPAGRTADGLPVGVQIVGPFLDDRSTIAVARAVSERLGGITPPPLAVG
jgi:amidase